MKRALSALLLTASLTGCATSWVVDSDVKSFSSLAAVPPGATYRFDRLPSQQADGARQDSLEAMAAAALDKVGLRRDDAHPQYNAQIGARVTAGLSPWADPWLYDGPWGYGWGGGYGYYGRRWYGGGWYGGPAFAPPANPWYEREVSIVLREAGSNRVVYETRARNDGPYTSSAAVLPVMFQAALQGFPNPPQGERRVNIELPTARK
ncbi:MULTISPECIES: DUF4136 domain-containing protein [Variovorax]|jgi:hypothetical protein|uniref:DUF4136 domain-containing protein n=2 Tax=Comamonadaceae TaxID=80864 RepID=UPI00086B24BA|nr:MULTISPECIES: DUF4136 domain-containing protein [Variovorax]MBN8751619.1 DUF4136 domain-containing protein [Variovorax sp.]ODU15210.1 MAG: hypothetical protein ABS94_18215 [Variovorax sp. SCN 67-85]OJZ04560.1 MAG: hypothetical protein BGP22_14035 [Variovorax sp. 67-131]UKI09754.1 DUF4136 domain-containing protein [Variovorax paradoxus]